MSESPKSYDVVYITSSDDGDTWSEPEKIPDNQSLHGAQLTVFGGKVLGIITSATKDQPKFLNVVSYTKNKGWTSEYLDKKYKAEGSVSVTVLGGRLYVIYRGTNNGVYLIYTKDGSNWTDLGRIGSKYSETHQSPAIHPFGKKLFLAGVGADKYVYYTITDKDGKREKSWTKMKTDADNAETTGGLVLTKFGFEEDDPEDPPVLLRGVHYPHFPNYAYGYQVFRSDEDGDVWERFQRVSIGIGGAAATPFKDGLFAAVLANHFDTRYTLMQFHFVKVFTGSVYSTQLNSAAPGANAGIAYLDGELFVSYAALPAENSRSTTYEPLTAMDEKMALAHRDAQWDCKWKKEDAPKVDLQSLIKGCFCL